MNLSGGRVPTDIRRTIEQQRQFINQLRGQIEELRGRLQTGQAPEAVADDDQILARAMLLHRQLLVFAGELKTLYRVARAQEDRLRQSSMDVVRVLLNAAEARDPLSVGHAARVGQIGAAIAGQLGLGDDQLAGLKLAGLLHDIGNLAVDIRIFQKPGPLTPEEQAEVRAHPVYGARILSGLSSLDPVLPAVRHHHERPDGAGYPDRLAGEAIPLPARIIAVAEVYDALISPRPHRPPLPPRAAAAQIRQLAGSQLDPTCVEAFLGAWKTGALSPPRTDRGGHHAQAQDPARR